jgi:hypothetical protein
MKPSEMVVVKIIDQPSDSSPCCCLLPTGGPEYFAFIQQKVLSLKAALEKAYPGKTRVDLPPAVVPSFKLGWGSSQARDPGGA